LDVETGFYYYGARYLDPKTSRWISADPAMGEYVPIAPINDEAKKHNQNLPGMGGIFNLVNMHVYHYAGNNPVKLIDPDGRTENITKDQMDYLKASVKEGKRLSGIEKGALAANLRSKIRDMNLEGLFGMDEEFMNGDLRDFLNTNNDGTKNYNEDEIVAGINFGESKWAINESNLFHRDPNYGSITKYEHEDGREVIFGTNLTNGKREQINSDVYQGTYNYAPGNLRNLGKHFSFDVMPWFKSKAGHQYVLDNLPKTQSNFMTSGFRSGH